MKNSISFLKKFVAGFIFCFLALWAEAKQIPTIVGTMQSPPGYGAGSIVVGVNATNLILTSPVANTLDYDVRNTISLKYDLNTDSFFLNKTTLAVKLKIDRWDISNNPMPQTLKKLTIFIDNKLNRVTLEQAILKLTNGYKVQVVIDSIWLNGVSVKTLPKWASVQSEINLDRYYNYSSPANTNALLTGITQLDTDCDLVTDEIQVNWSVPSMVPEEYQLEWTHVNNYAAGVGNYPASALSADFKNNSTRITTFNNSYRISLLFDQGYIAFRVRAVGRDMTNPTKIVYGPWSTVSDVVNIGSLVNNVSRFQVTAEHEKLKNWQYATTYAEEGKKKEVINYFDGSLHNRQTVTKINSDKNVIVGETMYDFQGRPAVNVLPVPVTFPNCTTATNEPAIKYYPKFNVDSTGQSYSKVDFDLDGGTCIPLIRRMDTTSGASKYYSNGNPDKNNQQAFLPHAKKFPFSQIEYTPDNTGRIRNQSGVGKDFKLGSGKETKYLYGQPNQLQVDRLFGSETGDASHYKKNVVIDANGQSSVTYLNQEGKTIATALAGIPPTEGIGGSLRMDSLEYANKNQAKFTIDLFNKNALGQSNLNTVPPSNDQIVFSSQLLVPFKSNYEFRYTLSVDTVHDACLRPGICFNCVYDMEIMVKNECSDTLNNIKKMTGKFTVSGPNIIFTTACSGPSLFNGLDTFNLTLDPGVYTVSKVLKINQAAKDFYVKSYTDSVYNSCFKTLSQFQAAALAQIDTSDCYTNCQTCVTALGSKDDFVSSGQGTELQWQFLVEKCNEPCRLKTLCRTTFDMMLSDVSPGGQYGKFNQVTFDASNEQLSVFNPANKLTPNILGGSAHWRSPKLLLNNVFYYQYLNEDGVRTKVDLVETSPGVYVPPVSNPGLVFTDPNTNTKQTYPENLAYLSDFIANWDAGFARSLVLYHPEYAYFVSCSDHEIQWAGDNKSSDKFDSLLIASETFAQAVSNNFIVTSYNNNNPALSKIKPVWNSTGSGVPYDPFFTNNNFQYNTVTNPNPVTGEYTTLNMSGANPWSVNLQTEMNYIVNNYRFIGATPYTMADVAAIIARCGNNFGATPTAACLAFGKDYNILWTPAQNDSVRNKEWRLFKQFYLAEKQKLQWKRMNFYAKYSANSPSNYYGGCNACIGTSAYNPWASGMVYPPPNHNYPKSAYYDGSQPCNWQNYSYYTGVTKRFYDPANTGLNTNVGPLVYQMTGQCPLAFQLQNFLNRMTSSSFLLTNNLSLNTVNEFNTDLYLAISGGLTPPPVFINYKWQVVTSVGNVFTANIVDPSSSQVKCVFTIDKTGTSIPNFASIIGINQLQFDIAGGGNGAFKAVAVYVVGTSTLSANIKGKASCLDIKNCNFSEQCSPNQFASDMQALLNFVRNAGQLNTFTPFKVFKDSVGKFYLTPTLKNILSPLASAHAKIQYQFISPNKYTIFDSTDVNTKIVITFISINPPSAPVTTFANIRSNYNNLFKLDGMNGNIKSSDIDGKAERTTLTQTVGLSMGDCSLPQPPDCQQKEHKVRRDLELLVKEMLTSTPFNNYNFNLFNLASFSPLLKSYFGSLTSTNGSYYTQTGPSPNVDTLRIKMFSGANGCTFKIFHWRNNGSTLNFPNVTNVTDLVGIGSQDIAGNYNQFRAIATYVYGSNTYKDTIYGISCWPIKNCLPCPPDSSVFTSLAKKDSALVSSGKAIYNPAIPAYSEYKTVVDSLNMKQGWTSTNPNYVQPISFAEFSNKGLMYSKQYLKFIRHYDTLIDKKTMLVPDSFVYNYGNLTNCNREYDRYVKATAEYNLRASSVTGAVILSAIKDSTFYTNHLCDSAFAYIKYLRDYPAAGPNAKDILQYFNIYNSNPIYLDSCKIEYEVYRRVHDQFLKDPIAQANCKESGILHPLYSYDEIVKQNLCCTNQGFTMFKGYVGSLANASVSCPASLPSLNSCIPSAAYAPITELCQRYYLAFIAKINQFNASAYAAATSCTLDPNIYPTYYSFKQAGYCDCVLSYINYLNSYIGTPPPPPPPPNALVIITPTLCPKSIDEWNGCPHSVPPIGQDSCRKRYAQYDMAVANYNTYVYSHPELGLTPINTIVQFEEFVKNFCNCFPKFLAGLNAIMNGYKPTPEELKIMLDLPTVCDEKPCVNGPQDSAFVFPPYTKYDNPCVQQQINLALQNAANAYQQYYDSLTTYFADKYTRHCLNALENFVYKYYDKEYHFTLYYYDQAGNLIKTVPPEGVEPINIISYLDTKAQQIISDRTYNQQNVFTEHRMATSYVYNSLNQLIYQSLPDHDNISMCDGFNPNGLDTGLVINAIHFVSPNKGYLCGYIRNGSYKRGLVYTSSDGGGTWTKINGVTSGNLQKVQFTSSSIGYAVSDFGMVFKTVDGGNNWDLLTGLYNPTSGTRFVAQLNALLFNGSFGLVGGNKDVSGPPSIFYTTNGGSTFSPASSIVGETPGDTITGFGFDGTGVYIASSRNGATGKLFSSTNGTSWNLISSYSVNNLKRVNYVSNTVAFAVGEDGTLIKGNPANSSWVLVPTSTAGNFRDVYFKNATEGIALIDSVPGKAKLYKSFDGGVTWQQFGLNGDYYNSLQAYDATHVLAVGSRGLGFSLVAKLLLSTQPFGITYIPTAPYFYYNELSYADGVMDNTQNTLLSVMVMQSSVPGNYITVSNNALSANPVWISYPSTSSFGIPVADASFKKVLVSSTGGATPTIKALLLTTTGKLYAFHKPYNLAASCRRVDTLDGVPASNQFFIDITANSQSANTNFYAYDNFNNKIYRVAFNTTGLLYKAKGFSKNNSPAIIGQVNSIEMHNTNDELLIVGNSGFIEHTGNLTPPTLSWTDVSKNVSPIAFNGVRNISGNNFIAVGIDGSVWNTSNITDWNLRNSGTAESLNSVGVNSFGNGLIAASNGKLFKLTNASTTPLIVNVPTGITSRLTDVAIQPSGPWAYVSAAGGEVLFISNFNLPVPSPVVATAYPQSVNGVAFKNGPSAIAVGSDVLVANYFGTSSGVTKNLFTRTLNSIHFFDNNNGFVIDSNDVIRRTTNGGATWSVVLPRPGSPNLNGIHSTKANQAVLIGDNKFAAVINNNVLTTLASPGVPANTNFYGISFNSSNKGAIVGAKTHCARIVPSGPNSFAITYIGQAFATTPFSDFRAVHVFNDVNNSFIAAGDLGRIYYWNSGFFSQMNYVPVAGALQSSITFKDIFFQDRFTGYVVGDKGQAFKIKLTGSPINVAGLSAGSLNWAPFCSDALYLGYTTNPPILNLDFRAVAFASPTDGMIGGANSNVTIAGINPNKYSRLLKEQSDFYSTRFWYDKLGRLILSQNTKQFNKKNPLNNLVKQAYSYTLYDNLGRIVEVGEKYENHTAGSPKFNNIFGSLVNGYYNTNVIDDAKLQLWITASGPRREVTKTYYDNQTILPLTYTQNNLRKRVATATYEDVYDGIDSTFNHATHYSYDIHGNVTTLWQDNRMVGVSGQRRKQINYEFDLISGKVNKVIYSPGQVDQFIHRYAYDADNRITRVETSKDNVTYELDAKYFYYAHGPLARVEYGKDHVQGVDYAYTLQGWIKGVNSNALKKAKDMGRDGDNSFVNPNGNFARDVMGYTLKYFEGDYEAVDFVKWNTANTRFEAYTNNSDLMNSRNDLFNGNISAMVTTISKPDSTLAGVVKDPIALPLGNAYRYDQLNRIKRSKSFTNIDTLSTNPNPNKWLNNNASAIGLYRNTFTYDANGNIMTQVKRDSLGNIIDSLAYQYEMQGPNKKRNRLYNVRDYSGFAPNIGDIKDQGPFTLANINSNYRYDEIGNLRYDSLEEIKNIEWMVNGKVKSVTRKTGSAKNNLVFEYDAQGNRIAKHVYTSANVWKYSTFYLRDAQGNVMSVYDKRTIGVNMSYKLDEQHLYGTNRIGMTNPDIQIIGAVNNSDSSKIYLGKKQYELGNHLGNVLTTISDKKIQIQNATNPFQTGHYVANVVSTSDYYPFGQEIFGRRYSSPNYRYGFNGKEKDDEVKGSGNSYDFGKRMFDSRLGRFLTVDPIVKDVAEISPYQYANNTPISAVDLEGLEFYYAADGSFIGKIGTSSQVRVVDQKDVKTVSGYITWANYSKAPKYQNYATGQANNFSKATKLTNAELNTRAFMSTLKQTENNYHEALPYNAKHGVNRDGSPKTFTEKKYEDAPGDYEKHPYEGKKGGTAAGAYQMLRPTFKAQKRANPEQIIDFGPKSQDYAVLQIFKGVSALNAIQSGNLENAISSLIKDPWGNEQFSSLPGGSQSHSKTMEDFKTLFKENLSKELTGKSGIALEQGETFSNKSQKKEVEEETKKK